MIAEWDESLICDQHSNREIENLFYYDKVRLIFIEILIEPKRLWLGGKNTKLRLLVREFSISS